MTLLILGLVVFMLWILGFVAFHVASAGIHILLIVALVAFIWHFVRRAAGGAGPAD